jgi:hypothetical protein
MATVKEINHDSSTTLSDHYTTTISDPDGGATVTVPAALNGSTNGVNIDYDAGTNFITLEEDFTALVGNDFRWRFRLDFSNVSFSGDVSTVLQFFLNSGASFIFRISMTYDTVNFLRIASSYYNDSGIAQSIGTFDPVPLSEDICIELRAIRETGATAADGEVELFVNGVSRLSISNAENFNRFALGIDRARLQWDSFDTDMTGDLFYDEWILTDDNATALCATVFSGYDLVLGGGQP